MTGLKNAGGALIARLTSALQKHPKRATAALATVLLTGGSGAFAVASLGPDPADLPVRTLTEPVTSLAAGQDLADLTDLQSFSLYRSEYTRANDTTESLLQRLGIADPQAAAFMRSNDAVRQNVLGRAGRLVSAETTPDQQLSQLTGPIIDHDKDVGEMSTSSVFTWNPGNTRVSRGQQFGEGYGRSIAAKCLQHGPNSFMHSRQHRGHVGGVRTEDL